MENLSTPNTIELQDALQEAREQELELEQTLQEVTHRLQQQKTLCSALSLLEEGNEQPMIEYLNSLGRKPASIVVGDSTIITLKRGKLEIL